MNQKYPRYADVTVDFAFKRVFGSEKYKEATIGLLRSIITDRTIDDIEFLNVEVPGLSADDRKACVDILCKSSDSVFIVEMQNLTQACFFQRTVLYSSTVISHLAEKGDGWDYRIRPTYVIAVINFDIHSSSDPLWRDRFISQFVTKEVCSGAVLPGAPQYFFLEPQRFDKKLEDLVSYSEKWLFLLRDVRFLENMPKMFRGDASFETYFSAAETANFSKTEREQYDKDMITKTDIKYALEYSHDKGVAEGVEKGIEKGIERGAVETARRMKADKLPVGTICKYTGLSEEQVAAITV